MVMTYELHTYAYIFGKYLDYLETYLECCAATTSPTVRVLLPPILTATTNNMLPGSSSFTMSSLLSSSSSLLSFCSSSYLLRPILTGNTNNIFQDNNFINHHHPPSHPHNCQPSPSSSKLYYIRIADRSHAHGDRDDRLASRLENPNPGFNTIFKVKAPQ